MRAIYELLQVSVIVTSTFLLTAESKSISNVTAITTTSTERPNDSHGEINVLNGTSKISSTENEQTEKYEIIDVSHGTKTGNQTTGRTTRIYTIGSVNDEFWLKHLGDDFKNAIHLQVGGNEQYNEIYNSTNPDGHREEVLHEYLPGSDFSNSHYNPAQILNKNNETMAPTADISNNHSIVPQTETAQNLTNTDFWSKTQPHDPIDNPQSFESLFTIDGSAVKFAHKYLQENSKNSIPVEYGPRNKVSNSQKKVAKNSQASASTLQTSTRGEYAKSAKSKLDTQTSETKLNTKNAHIPTSSYQTPNAYEEPSLSNLYASEPTELDAAFNKPTDASSQALISYILRKPGTNYEARLSSGLSPYQAPFKDFDIHQHRDSKQNIFERGI